MIRIVNKFAAVALTTILVRRNAASPRPRKIA